MTLATSKPRSLKIGPYTYKVSYDHAIHEKSVEAQTSLNGLCDPDSQIIYIHPDLHPDNVRATLIHETLHALFRLVGMESRTDWTAELEEAICSMLEGPLLSLIRDNGKVVDWIWTTESDH